MLDTLKSYFKMLATRHSPNGESNVFIHSLPRSGSTWLMELIQTQPGFMACNEPLNLRTPAVREHLGLKEWADLHRTENAHKLLGYFEKLSAGKLHDPRFHRPAPFTEFYRPTTRRIVFKIINAGEEYINRLSQSFNGRVVFLLRHPIPVSLSRNYFPKLDTFLNTDVRGLFDSEQLVLAERIVKGDNKFARGVLDWCLRNAVALRSRTDEWSIVTYEQLVQDPVPVVRHLAKRLSLPKPERILKRLKVPSQSTSLSDQVTRQTLHAGRDESKQRWLVEKWQERVLDDELKLADELLTVFKLSDIYTVTEPMPAAHWIS